jgi:hypothetical protein
MRTIALRLRPGADLKAELLALAAREGVQAGWVLTCVGSLSRARLRLASGAEVVVAVDDRLVFAREHDPATSYEERWSASATRRSGTAAGSWQSGSIRSSSYRLVAAYAREAAAGLADSRPKTHAEFRPAGATRWHSLPLAGQAILGADLRGWLFLLVTA